MWLSLLHYYLSISGFLAYLFIAIKRIRLSTTDLFLLLGLALLMVLHIFTRTPIEAVLDFRFYWGWLFFYFIFKANSVNYRTLEITLIALSVLTLVEAILVNTVITTAMLPNAPLNTNDYSNSVTLNGVYQRPYSFGGNGPVGSSILVALMAVCNAKRWLFWLSMLAVMSLASGTGLFVLMLLMLVRYRAKLIKAASWLFLGAFLGGILFSEEVQIIGEVYLDKIGPDYIILMASLLWFELTTFSDTIGDVESIMHILTGYSTHDQDGGTGHGGDWGILAFLSANGLIGVSLILSTIFARMNNVNRFPLFIIFLASVHYSAMSFLPGQMVIGLLLSITMPHRGKFVQCKA